MSTRKTVVDRTFETKVNEAVNDKDWTKVQELFEHYGHYLTLIEKDAQVPAQS